MPGSVIVVGSVNVDLVAAGGRLPGPGETVAMRRFAETHGGKGGNQASAAAALGAPTYLVGAVGDDHWGTAAREDLAARGVRLDGLRTVPGPTGIAIVLVDDAGENSIAVVAGANAAVTPEAVGASLAAIPAGNTDDNTDGDTDGDATGGVVVVACLEIPLPAVLAAARVARRRGWRFVLNPAPAPAGPLPAELLALTTVLTPNETEAAALGGVGALLAAGTGAVVVTKGGAGCELHAPHPVPVPAAGATVVDTTGAGDTFTAALAVALAAGRDLPAAVRFAAAAGALATEGFGARGALPSTAAVTARLADNR